MCRLTVSHGGNSRAKNSLEKLQLHKARVPVRVFDNGARVCVSHLSLVFSRGLSHLGNIGYSPSVTALVS